MSQSETRIQLVDALRGAGIIMMVVYHLCYDLKFMRWNQDWVDVDLQRSSLWIAFRTVILLTFLSMVGASIVLAHHRRGLRWRTFGRRAAVLAIACGLVTLSTWIMMGDYGGTVLFGVLHFILLASLLALPFRRAGLWIVPFGMGLIVIGWAVHHPLFDHPGLHWIGMMTRLPSAEDYVPLLPWFGVVLLGVRLGQMLSRCDPSCFALRWRARNPFGRLLVWSGRRSLWIYLIHQPVLLGALYIIKALNA